VIGSWAEDELLWPWRRGRLQLPFTTSERTAEEQRRRTLTIILVTGAAIAVIMFGVLVAFGAAPQIYRDPHTTIGPDDDWFAMKFSLGTAVIGMVALGGLILPFAGGGATALGHPWRFEATDEGLTLITADGERVAGVWGAWRLEDYRSAAIARGVPVITLFVLALGERTFEVEPMRMRRQRAFMRLVAQRIAV
jgi:hypothetical protein